jgi:hypothetical protein
MSIFAFWLLSPSAPGLADPPHVLQNRWKKGKGHYITFYIIHFAGRLSKSKVGSTSKKLQLLTLLLMFSFVYPLVPITIEISY